MVAVRLAERQWTHDRAGWADRFEVERTGITVEWGRVDGPWHHEPDKVQWVDLMTGYPCLAHRGQQGAWCGYVGLPPGHPHHGLDKWDAAEMFAAYGGINYSAPCDEGPDESFGVCHVPEPGQPDSVWWLGFDCAHLGDLAPFAPVFEWHGEPLFQPVYRTLAFVQVWCHILARQLAPKLLTALP